ncbi:MAG TPA: SpoIID/LytB domain-containing protein [Blastocatellia bacterium]|nr:SpoIID/LytB domain-containing protein [Blastocatellia bacterium]
MKRTDRGIGRACRLWRPLALFAITICAGVGLLCSQGTRDETGEARGDWRPTATNGAAIGGSSRDAFRTSSLGASPTSGVALTKLPGSTSAASIERADAELQSVAKRSLGDREGSIVVMDPETGRLRAVVNPRLAFEQAFPPGSAIKPFTALAAMRAGLIDPSTRRLCPGKYSTPGFQIVCSHPRSKSPFNLGQALAYSCNYYFAKVGEQLSSTAYEATLASFGFGRVTGCGAAESAGRIPTSDVKLKSKLGEGDEILVTPIQLIRAYVALFGGGHLLRPQRGLAVKRVEVSYLNIAAYERETLARGLRGALTYGTASKSGLASLPIYVFGKTGTSTSSNGFRTQGWFVGMASRPGEGDRPGLAVLVFLKRSHGSACAAVAQTVFAQYSRQVTAESKAGEPTEPVRLVPGGVSGTSNSQTDSPVVTVHMVTQNKTVRIPLEEYVLGVLGGEASIETKLEALQAQAVLTRTYALKNLGRHRSEGYDFCSTTHCQRYVVPPRLTRALAERAVAETSGQVLIDSHGTLADAYFHASCGGMTADIESLWGVPSRPYLKGVRDEYCRAMPHSHWVERIPGTALAQALSADPRSDPGLRLTNILVLEKDASGRAKTILIEGAHTKKRVRGWDFKLIVGRSLGWNVLKSSRFAVERDGSVFVFRGSGFGHGLGLCQEGAHVMAERGLSYKTILSHYLPGTVIASHLGIQESAVAPAISGAPLLPVRYRFAVADTAPGWLTLSSDHFTASFKAGTEAGLVEEVLRTLEAARSDMMVRLGTAAIDFDPTIVVRVVIYLTTQDFTAATALPWWAAGRTRGSQIDLQPLRVLAKRGVLIPAVRHEYAHCVIDKLSRGRAPHWLAEGLAIYFAGERPMLLHHRSIDKLSTDEIERRLAEPLSENEMRTVYAAAYNAVFNLIRRKGESFVWQAVKRGSGMDLKLARFNGRGHYSKPGQRDAFTHRLIA